MLRTDIYKSSDKVSGLGMCSSANNNALTYTTTTCSLRRL